MHTSARPEEDHPDDEPVGELAGGARACTGGSRGWCGEGGMPHVAKGGMEGMPHVATGGMEGRAYPGQRQVGNATMRRGPPPTIPTTMRARVTPRGCRYI